MQIPPPPQEHLPQGGIAFPPPKASKSNLVISGFQQLSVPCSQTQPNFSSWISVL